MRVEVVKRVPLSFPVARLRAATERSIAALRRMGYGRKRRYTLFLVFVPKRESQKLHRMFLKKKRPADILSFDYGAFGELVLAPELIWEEARRSGRPFFEEAVRLIIHGIVHLLGLHHERSRRLAEKTSRIEQIVFRRLGQKSPGEAGRLLPRRKVSGM